MFGRISMSNEILIHCESDIFRSIKASMDDSRLKIVFVKPIVNKQAANRWHAKLESLVPDFNNDHQPGNNNTSRIFASNIQHITRCSVAPEEPLTLFANPIDAAVRSPVIVTVNPRWRDIVLCEVINSTSPPADTPSVVPASIDDVLALYIVRVELVDFKAVLEVLGNPIHVHAQQGGPPTTTTNTTTPTAITPTAPNDDPLPALYQHVQGALQGEVRAVFEIDYNTDKMKHMLQRYDHYRQAVPSQDHDKSEWGFIVSPFDVQTVLMNGFGPNTKFLTQPTQLTTLHAEESSLIVCCKIRIGNSDEGTCNQVPQEKIQHMYDTKLESGGTQITVYNPDNILPTHVMMANSKHVTTHMAKTMKAEQQAVKTHGAKLKKWLDGPIAIPLFCVIVGMALLVVPAKALVIFNPSNFVELLIPGALLLFVIMLCIAIPIYITHKPTPPKYVKLEWTSDDCKSISYHNNGAWWCAYINVIMLMLIGVATLSFSANTNQLHDYTYTSPSPSFFGTQHGEMSTSKWHIDLHNPINKKGAGYCYYPIVDKSGHSPIRIWKMQCNTPTDQLNQDIQHRGMILGDANFVYSLGGFTSSLTLQAVREYFQPTPSMHVSLQFTNNSDDEMMFTNMHLNGLSTYCPFWMNTVDNNTKALSKDISTVIQQVYHTIPPNTTNTTTLYPTVPPATTNDSAVYNPSNGTNHEPGGVLWEYNIAYPSCTSNNINIDIHPLSGTGSDHRVCVDVGESDDESAIQFAQLLKNRVTQPHNFTQTLTYCLHVDYGTDHLMVWNQGDGNDGIGKVWIWLPIVYVGLVGVTWIGVGVWYCVNNRPEGFRAEKVDSINIVA